MPSLHTTHHQPFTALIYTSLGPIIIGFLMFSLAVFVSVSIIVITLPAILSLVLIIGILIASAFTVIYPVVQYLLFTYQLTEESITVNSGVLFRQYETINFNRIQVIDNERNPILMLLGLTRVEIWTASPDQVTSSVIGHPHHARPDTVLLLGKHAAEALKSFILHRPVSSID